MEGSRPDAEAIAGRLERAAARLKAEGEPARTEPPAGAGSDLNDVLAGLAQARVEVRRARDRLEDLRARLEVS